eukprot:6482249-Amphidinium_carterae.1
MPRVFQRRLDCWQVIARLAWAHIGPWSAFRRQASRVVALDVEKVVSRSAGDGGKWCGCGVERGDGGEETSQ